MDLKKSDTSPIADPVHIQEKRSELKSLQEKCDLQSVDLTLFRRKLNCFAKKIKKLNMHL